MWEDDPYMDYQREIEYGFRANSRQQEEDPWQEYERMQREEEMLRMAAEKEERRMAYGETA